MKIALFIFYLLIFNKIFAQNQYYPIKKNNLWGVINHKGQIECNPKYDFIELFNNKGFAAVRHQDKMGIIDNKGNLVVPFLKKTLRLLDNNFIVFKDSLSWGLMNFSQKIILEPLYSKIEQIKNIDTNAALDFLIIFTDKNGLKGCVNKQGEIVTEPRYAYIDFIKIDSRNNSDEIISLKNAFVSTGERRLLYAKGTQVLTTQGAIRDRNIRQRNFNNVSITINTRERNRVIALAEKTFREEAILTSLDNKNGLYDIKTDKIVVPALYNDYEIQADKIVFYEDKAMKGIYSKKRFYTFPHQGYEEIIPDSTLNISIAKIKNGKWGIINDAFMPLTPFSYDDISEFRQNLAQVEQRNLYGIINARGVLVVPTQYIKVRMQGKTGKFYKDNNGNCTIYDFDSQGNVIDKYDMVLKSITIRNANREGQAEWEFIKRNITNNANNANFMARRNGINLEHPNNSINADYQTESFEMNNHRAILDTTQKNKPVWSVHLKNDKILFGNHIYLTRQRKIALIFLRQLDEQKNPTNTCFIVNLEKGIEIVRKRFVDVENLNNDIERLENDEYILVSTENALVNIEGHFIGQVQYINPLTKKLETTLISHIESRSLLNTNFHRLVVKATYKYKTKDIIAGIYGLVNLKTGKIITTPQYTQIDIKQGFIKVWKDKKCGVLDEDGKELCPAIYDNIDYLSEDKSYYKIWQTDRKMYAVIDSTGKIYFNFKYDKFEPFKYGVACVQKNKKWGIIKPDGTEIIPPTYSLIRTASEGFLAFRKDNFCGFFDTKGQIVIEPKRFSQVGDFKNGVAWVIEKGKYGVINQQGELIIPTKFTKIEDFYGEVALAQNKGEWGLIDKKGNWKIKPNYKVHYSDKIFPKIQRVILADEVLEEVLFDFNGKKLSSKYQEINVFSENFAVVKIDNQKFNFINLAGKKISPQDFEDLQPFSEGLAIFTKKGLKGFIDTTGKIVIEAQYKSATSFFKGFAKVKEKNKEYFIDISGQEKKLPFDLDWRDFEINVMNVRIPQKDKICKTIYKNGYVGLIDNKERILCPAKYQSISEFSEGYAFVGASYFQGLLDLKGKIILEAENEDIVWAGEGVFGITQYGKLGYWHLSNRWLWALQD